MHADRQTLEPLLLSAADAARLLGIGRSSFYAWLSSGRIGPMEIRLGDGNRAKPLFSLTELRLWIASKNPETGELPSRQKWVEMQKGTAR